MIECKSLRQFSTESDEGKMLLAAISILTSIDVQDIRENKFGGMSHPDDVVSYICVIANKIYFEEEYKQYQEALIRDMKINLIID